MAWLAALAGAIICAAASPAIADPLAGSSLPAETRWVIHVDTDGAHMAQPLWNMARLRFVEPQRVDLLPKIVILERVTGMKLPQDLHDVTLFGTSYDQSGVCLRIHGKMDETNVTSFLQADPEFRQEPHNSHTIMTWRDKNADRLMFASFAKPDLAILSASSKAVADALDTLDGKTPGLRADSPLSPPTIDAGTAQPIVWLAGEKLSDLPRMQQTESPLIAQMDAASLSIKWVNDRALAEMRVTAKTEKSAQQMQAVAEGVKAFVSLAASDEHATARNRLLATLVQTLRTETDGKTLKGDWALDLDRVDVLINTIRVEQGGASVTKPASPPNGKP